MCHGSKPETPVSKPLTNFKKALEILSKHTDKDHHRGSIVKSEEFMKVISNVQLPIASVFNTAVADQVALNRQKLMSIFKTIVLCRKQNISLCSHRFIFTDLEKDITDSGYHGNFLAQLCFRTDPDDTVLQDHLARPSRNATYTSSYSE
uniref:Uncharacterized protein n=1 Tax=Amphimedon queenslandica TaxID=400682 RepID=A0A1X7TTV4_AMPQE